MRYIGGKARQARRITDAMLARRGDATFYLEPFLGAASVAHLMAPHFDHAALTDAHLDIPHLWRAVRDGWVPPAEMDQRTYEELRHRPPSAYRAWAGFAASYNGKWFGGYGPTAPSAGRDYLAEAQRAALRKAEGLARTSIHWADYRQHLPGKGWLVYCDPPYEDTMGYYGGGLPPTFDHEEFWATMNTWADLGARVFVSEYAAPEGWTSVLDCGRIATVHHSGSRPKRTEGLFTPMENL